jgi:dTDP-4-dehydrorhamnose reductase
MKSVLVLGADGMLGSMIARVLSTKSTLRVVRCSRTGGPPDFQFDASRDTIEELLAATRTEWIVNAIGILDRHIDENDPDSVAAAIHVNATFPNRLAAAASRHSRVIHFTTDGVYSGRDAPYDEKAPHDAVGVYARSKSLGEPRSPNCVNLRCSIIGPESLPASSLLGRILSQPPGTVLTGYTNHRWNGVTTLHLARLCAAVIQGNHIHLPSVLHVVPGDVVSKAELISLCLLAFGRNDLTVDGQPAPIPANRTLRTVHPEINRRLWAAAGHAAPPTIDEMVRELASTCHR